MARRDAKVLGNPSIYPFPPTNSGHVLYTGPDGVGDYNANLCRDPTYIGIGPKSLESSNDVKHIFGPDFVEKPRRKHEMLGEIGCDVRNFIEKLSKNENDSRRNSALAKEVTLNPMKPIVHGPFRTAVENNAIFHKYQEPWYPDKENSQLYLGWPTNTNRKQISTVRISAGQNRRGSHDVSGNNLGSTSQSDAGSVKASKTMISQSRSNAMM